MQSPPYPSDRASAPSTLRRIRRGRICRPLCNHTIPSHPDQMGQGASTPQQNDRDTGASSQGENAGEDSRDSARVHPTVRRSRRIRNSITRLGGRLMRSGSSISHGSGASAIPPRGPISRARLRAGLRSSPPIQNTGALSPRSISRPQPVTLPPILSPELPSEIEPDGDLTMSDDIDGVTVTPPYTSEVGSSPEAQSPNDTPSVYRRSRLGGRSSISTTLPHLLAELGSPRSTGSSSRRNSQFRPGLYDSFGSHDFEDTMDLEIPSRSNTPSEPISRRPHPDFTPFGDPNTMDLLENPRVRPGEDQAAMLSRLLSVAAAMTAASLVGSSEQALTEAQDVAGDSVDGSFESFLRALQNGRLAAALRNGGNEMGGGVPSEPSLDGNLAPLNFFRMFRFGTTNTTNQQETASATPPPRMVPVIIVGIRSVTPRESTNQTEPVPPPFMDTLSTLSTRRSRMRHGSRRASMGAVGENSGLSGRAARPASEVLFPTIPPIPDTPQGPHPPPSTPADLGVSPLTPSTTSSVSNNSAESSTGSRNAEFSSGTRTQRRQSEPHSIPSLPHESSSEPSTSSGDSTTQTTGQAGHRRQGGEGTRSWIIYVLGGSYPENHPILTTPSLFTDVSSAFSLNIPPLTCLNSRLLMRTCYYSRPSLGRRSRLLLPEKTLKPLVDYSLLVIVFLLMRLAIDTS